MRWDIAILYAFIRLLGQLPLRWLHGLGAGLGWLLWLTPNPLKRKATQTLSHVLTQFEGKTRQQLLKASLIETGKSLFEICRIWNGNTTAALSLVREVRGTEHIPPKLDRSRGVIIAAPHLGCWELLNYWGASQAPMALVYRRPRIAALDPLLLKARGALGTEQIAVGGMTSVRRILKRLEAGGAVGILPDQQPKLGEGKFAPFFGTPALTMVLLSRLAQRTGATVLFAFAERLPRGAGFRMHLRPAPDGIADPDPTRAVAALNRGVEDCVRIAPEQYQWAYKRYSIRPEAGP